MGDAAPGQGRIARELLVEARHYLFVDRGQALKNKAHAAGHEIVAWGDRPLAGNQVGGGEVDLERRQRGPPVEVQRGRHGGIVPPGDDIGRPAQLTPEGLRARDIDRLLDGSDQRQQGRRQRQGGPGVDGPADHEADGVAHGNRRGKRGATVERHARGGQADQGTLLIIMRKRLLVGECLQIPPGPRHRVGARVALTGADSGKLGHATGKHAHAVAQQIERVAGRPGARRAGDGEIELVGQLVVVGERGGGDVPAGQAALVGGVAAEGVHGQAERGVVSCVGRRPRSGCAACGFRRPGQPVGS